MIIGHRGFGKGVVAGYTENTISSVRAAVAAGAPWVEVDVRRTRDDDLVVLHNPTCVGESFVSDLTAAQVTELGLVRLGEVLAELPDGVGLDIDLKSSLEDGLRDRDATTAALIAPIVGEAARRRPIMVSSFDAAALLIVRERIATVPLALLTWFGFPLRKAVPMAVHLGLDAVIAHAASFGANRIDPAPVHRAAGYSIRVARQAGLTVGAWCPEPSDALELIDAGAELLVVNDLPGTLAAVHRDEPGEVGQPAQARAAAGPAPAPRGGIPT